jgi:AAA ATPase-like protein
VSGLRGRRSECKSLEQLVTSVRTGQSRVLVLRGEAGIGKTALLEYLASCASECRIARATGVESEMELAFAGLHQLCAPFLDRLDRLPVPQRDALGTAFGLLDGNAPDRFLIGLAVLSLLSDVAEDRPLVCLVDDVVAFGSSMWCEWSAVMAVPIWSCGGLGHRHQLGQGAAPVRDSLPRFHGHTRLCLTPHDDQGRTWHRDVTFRGAPRSWSVKRVRPSREVRAGTPGFRRLLGVCVKQSVTGPTPPPGTFHSRSRMPTRRAGRRGRPMPSSHPHARRTTMRRCGR